MLRRSTSLACASLLLATASAWAEDKPAATTEEAPEQDAIIESLTLESLAALLTEIGAEEVTSLKEEKTVRFKSAARNFFVTLGACDEATGACAIATVGRAVKAKLPLEVLNKLNENYVGLLTATRVNENLFKMVRGIILGGGTTKTNVSVNIVWYVKETPEFEKLITSQLVAANQNANPQTQNTSSSIALGEIVLTPEEIGKLVEQVHFPKKGEPMSLPKK